MNENVLKPLMIPDLEPSWEDEINPMQNILNAIEKDAEQRDVLRNYTNESPSVLKAMREEERRKTRERLVIIYSFTLFEMKNV